MRTPYASHRLDKDFDGIGFFFTPSPSSVATGTPVHKPKRNQICMDVRMYYSRCVYT